jgi:hypothetical protein
MTRISNVKEFIEKVRNLASDEYIVLGEYINSKIKIKTLHCKCSLHDLFSEISESVNNFV